MIRNYIGPSELGDIFNLPKSYKSQVEIIQRLKNGGYVEDKQNDATELGTYLESGIRELYSHRIGAEIVKTNERLQDVLQPYFQGTPDGKIPVLQAIYEGKTHLTYQYDPGEWGPDFTDEVPLKYFLQCQGYMILSGYKTTHLVCAMTGPRLAIYYINYDSEIENRIRKKLKETWEHAQNDTWPESESVSDLRIIYEASKDLSIEASEEIIQVVENLADINSEIKRLNSEFEACKGKIMAFMGECETLVSGGIKLASWKPDKNGKRVFRNG